MALAKIITASGVPVIVHGLLDGRDTPPQSGIEFVKTFEAALPKGARIGTLIGLSGSSLGRALAFAAASRWAAVAFWIRATRLITRSSMTGPKRINRRTYGSGSCVLPLFCLPRM